ELAGTLLWVQRYFHEGSEQGLWDNAEQFLAYVDDAYQAASAAKKMRLQILVFGSGTLLGRPGKVGLLASLSMEEQAAMAASLDRKVRRALAAECHRFVLVADPQSEGWLPYREWVRSLQPDQDTVVSFNYDRVVE